MIVEIRASSSSSAAANLTSHPSAPTTEYQTTNYATHSIGNIPSLHARPVLSCVAGLAYGNHTSASTLTKRNPRCRGACQCCLSPKVLIGLVIADEMSLRRLFDQIPTSALVEQDSTRSRCTYHSSRPSQMSRIAARGGKSVLLGCLLDIHSGLTSVVVWWLKVTLRWLLSAIHSLGWVIFLPHFCAFGVVIAYGIFLMNMQLTRTSWGIKPLMYYNSVK